MFQAFFLHGSGSDAIFSGAAVSGLPGLYRGCPAGQYFLQTKEGDAMRIPKHIGIIPDGNRRWASQAGLEKKDGYVHGLTPGLELLRLARQAGVEEITYYGFTTDNCGRPQEQVRAFSAACVEAVKLIAAEPVSLLVIGNTEASVFPKELLPYTGARADLNGGGIRVNFLVNYGWEWDLAGLDRPGSDRKQIYRELHSHDVSRVDLVIRWGGHAPAVRIPAGAVGLCGFLCGGPALARFPARGFPSGAGPGTRSRILPWAADRRSISPRPAHSRPAENLSGGCLFVPGGRNIDTRFCVWYNTYILFALHRTSGIPGETTVQTEQAVSLFVWKSSGSRAGSGGSR